MIPRSPLASLAGVVLASAFSSALLAGCASKPAPASETTTVKATAEAPAPPTKVTSFAVSNENLNVDVVGLHGTKSDGSRDLAFTATVEGAFDAMFIASVSDKGDPMYGLRADTLAGNEEIPTELGGLIDIGKMTVAIGVVENGKFINSETGSVRAGPGVHSYKLYVANSATLRPGSFVRLYLRAPGGALVRGPVTAY